MSRGIKKYHIQPYPGKNKAPGENPRGSYSIPIISLLEEEKSHQEVRFIDSCAADLLFPFQAILSKTKNRPLCFAEVLTKAGGDGFRDSIELD